MVSSPADEMVDANAVTQVVTTSLARFLVFKN
jgi:hypothetical protein